MSPYFLERILFVSFLYRITYKHYSCLLPSSLFQFLLQITLWNCIGLLNHPPFLSSIPSFRMSYAKSVPIPLTINNRGNTMIIHELQIAFSARAYSYSDHVDAQLQLPEPYSYHLRRGSNCSTSQLYSQEQEGPHVLRARIHQEERSI